MAPKQKLNVFAILHTLIHIQKNKHRNREFVSYKNSFNQEEKTDKLQNNQRSNNINHKKCTSELHQTNLTSMASNTHKYSN